MGNESKIFIISVKTGIRNFKIVTIYVRSVTILRFHSRIWHQLHPKHDWFKLKTRLVADTFSHVSCCVWCFNEMYITSLWLYVQWATWWEGFWLQWGDTIGIAEPMGECHVYPNAVHLLNDCYSYVR